MKRLLWTALLILCIVALSACSLLYTAYDSALPDKLTRGVVADNVYTSEYAGLKFTAPAGWVFGSDEDMAELMDIGADALGDAGLEYTEEALKKQTLYDMMCQDTSTGSSMLLLYENLALSGNTGITEEKYIEETRRLLKEADVYEYEFADTSEETLAGQTCKVMRADVTDYGFTQYYYVRKVDKYMLCIVFTIPGGVELSDVTGCVEAYEAEETASS